MANIVCHRLHIRMPYVASVPPITPIPLQPTHTFSHTPYSFLFPCRFILSRTSPLTDGRTGRTVVCIDPWFLAPLHFPSPCANESPIICVCVCVCQLTPISIAIPFPFHDSTHYARLTFFCALLLLLWLSTSPPLFLTYPLSLALPSWPTTTTAKSREKAKNAKQTQPQGSFAWIVLLIRRRQTDTHACCLFLAHTLSPYLLLAALALSAFVTHLSRTLSHQS